MRTQSKAGRRRRSPSEAATLSEREIQDALQRLLGEGGFYNAIDGKSELARALEAIDSEFLLPSFPLDYLVWKRFLLAAASILGRLKSPTIVSTARSSISWDKKERLFPDFLLCDEDLAVFTAVEIKSSRQTEREAITELLGYDHEIRNHLPFSSNSDVGLVIVSTEFGPLLSHSLAALVVWERREVLCLKVRVAAGKIQFAVHLPDPWTAVGQRSLSGKALMTSTLCLYEAAATDPSRWERVLLPAASLLARESERSSSSGFLLLWEDSWYPDVTSTPFNLTVGWINPYAFLGAVVREGVAPSPAKPFDRLLRSGAFAHLGEVYKPGSDLYRKGLALLETNCDPRWEGRSTWETERFDPQKLRNRAIPLHLDCWGLLGDYVREIFVHPASRNHFMPELTRTGLDLHHPIFAVPLLDAIGGIGLFEGGKFTCQELMRFGVRLGVLYALSKRPVAAGDEEKPDNIAALFAWTQLDLISALREVRERCHSTDEIKRSPPKITLRSYDKRGDSASEIEAWVRWITEDFIGPGYPAHQEFFLCGVHCYPFFEPSFSEPADLLGRARDHAAELSRKWLKVVAFELIPDLIDKAAADRLIASLSRLYGVVREKASATAFEESAIDAIPRETHLRRLEHELPAIVDMLVDDFTHSLKALEPGTKVDWHWLRRQVVKLRTQGVECPAISIAEDGGISTVRLDPRTGRAFGTVELGTHVLLVNHLPGVPVVTVESWKNLEAGNPWRQERKARSSSRRRRRSRRRK